jgi:hypothetical protein
LVNPNRQATTSLGPDEQVAKQKYHALVAGRQSVGDCSVAQVAEEQLYELAA